MSTILARTIDNNYIYADRSDKDGNGNNIASTYATKSEVPAAQVNADWNSVSGVSEILNKPASKPMAAGSGISITEGNESIVIANTGSNVPVITSTDDGKVLTASYDNGTTSYSWETAPGGQSVAFAQGLTNGTYFSFGGYASALDGIGWVWGKNCSVVEINAAVIRLDGGTEGVSRDVTLTLCYSTTGSANDPWYAWGSRENSLSAKSYWEYDSGLQSTVERVKFSGTIILGDPDVTSGMPAFFNTNYYYLLKTNYHGTSLDGGYAIGWEPATSSAAGVKGMQTKLSSARDSVIEVNGSKIDVRLGNPAYDISAYALEKRVGYGETEAHLTLRSIPYDDTANGGCYYAAAHFSQGGIASHRLMTFDDSYEPDWMNFMSPTAYGSSEIHVQLPYTSTSDGDVYVLHLGIRNEWDDMESGTSGTEYVNFIGTGLYVQGVGIVGTISTHDPMWEHTSGMVSASLSLVPVTSGAVATQTVDNYKVTAVVQ